SCATPCDHSSTHSHRDLHCPSRYGKLSLGQGDVIVVTLVPAACDPYTIRHRVQFVLRVRDHVTHDHMTEGRPHVVDVDSHCRLSCRALIFAMSCRLSHCATTFAVGPGRSHATISVALAAGSSLNVAICATPMPGDVM